MAALTCPTTPRTAPLKYSFNPFHGGSSILTAAYDGEEKVG
jgi:hypothetical protein